MCASPMQIQTGAAWEMCWARPHTTGLPAVAPSPHPRARSTATDGPRQFHAWVAGMYGTAQQGLDDWRRMELDLLQNMERQVRCGVRPRVPRRSRCGLWVCEK